MRIHRAVLIALLIGLAPVVAGCTDGFDMDKLDVLGLNKKKPLPGERHALFPQGVPGVQQGIPAEYMKGNVAQGQQPGAAVPIDPLKPEQAQPAQTASAEPAAEAKPKPAPKKRVAAKPKPTRVNVSQKPPAQPAAAQGAAAPWPAAPPPQQPAQQPAQQASSPWPNEQQPAPAPWPSAPPPGTFSKQ
jgi:hypothetical protein